MKKKLITSLIAVVLLLSSVLVVCAACETRDYNHTIYFYSSQGATASTVTQQAIDAFQAKFPGWKVQHVRPGGYDEVRDKVSTELSSDMQPDLAYCYPDHVAMYIQSRQILDFDQFIYSTETVPGKKVTTNQDANGNVTTTTEDADFSVGYENEEFTTDFYDMYLKDGYAESFEDYDKYGYEAGKLLALPFVRSTEIMYYNKTALDELGYDPATTWDELWTQCRQIHSKWPKAMPLAYDSEANWFIIMCEQNGWDYTTNDNITKPADHYQFNNENTQKWLTELRQLYLDKLFITKQAYNGQYTSSLFIKGVANNAGGAVYCIGSSGGASNQSTNNFTVGVAPIPGSNLSDGSVNYSNISQGPSLCMFRCNKADNPDEKAKMTFMFVKELLDAEFQAKFVESSGYSSVRKSTEQTETYKNFISKSSVKSEVVKLSQQMMQQELFFVSPSFIGSSKARTQVGNALYLAMTGQNTPAKALEIAYRNCAGAIR